MLKYQRNGSKAGELGREKERSALDEVSQNLSRQSRLNYAQEDWFRSTSQCCRRPLVPFLAVQPPKTTTQKLYSLNHHLAY